MGFERRSGGRGSRETRGPLGSTPTWSEAVRRWAGLCTRQPGHTGERKRKCRTSWATMRLVGFSSEWTADTAELWALRKHDMIWHTLNGSLWIQCQRYTIGRWGRKRETYWVIPILWSEKFLLWVVSREDGRQINALRSNLRGTHISKVLAWARNDMAYSY